MGSFPFFEVSRTLLASYRDIPSLAVIKFSLGVITSTRFFLVFLKEKSWETRQQFM